MVFFVFVIVAEAEHGHRVTKGRVCKNRLKTQFTDLRTRAFYLSKVIVLDIFTEGCGYGEHERTSMLVLFHK